MQFGTLKANSRYVAAKAYILGSILFESVLNVIDIFQRGIEHFHHIPSPPAIPKPRSATLNTDFDAKFLFVADTSPAGI